MRYVEFKEKIRKALVKRPAGFTWKQLKARLRLSYDRPCPTWVANLEKEIGLVRKRGEGRALVWTLGSRKR
jgi:hypothetical protein